MASTLAETIGEEGEIKLPQDYRDRLGLKNGDSVDVVGQGSILFIRPHDRSKAQVRAELDDIFANLDAINAEKPKLTDDEALQIANEEIAAARQERIS